MIQYYVTGLSIMRSGCSQTRAHFGGKKTITDLNQIERNDALWANLVKNNEKQKLIYRESN